MKPTLTPKFRVSFPNVFKPRLNDQNGKQEYSIVALFKKGENLDALKKLAQNAIEKKWGNDPKKWPVNLRSPFRLQEERRKDGVLPLGYEEGAVFVNLKSIQRPGLVDASVQDIIQETDFYAGCWARATVSAYAYGGPGTSFAAGVAFGLGNVQKMEEGVPLGGRTKPEDDFQAIQGAPGTELGNPASANSIFG